METGKEITVRRLFPFKVLDVDDVLNDLLDWQLHIALVVYEYVSLFHFTQIIMP